MTGVDGVGKVIGINSDCQTLRKEEKKKKES